MKSMRQPRAEREGTRGSRMVNAGRMHVCGECCAHLMQGGSNGHVWRVEEKRKSGLTLHARLRRQDKAGFPASGTSFLSFCLHIVFTQLVLSRRGEAGALLMFSSLF